MNCHRFEMIVNDLARNQPLDAATCDRALAHAKICPQCAARLAGERAVTAGLQTVAESAGDQQAPPLIEAALRRAFRERASVVNASAIRFAPARAGDWTHWAAGTAATILVALSVLWPLGRQEQLSDALQEARSRLPKLRAQTQQPRQLSPERAANPTARLGENVLAQQGARPAAVRRSANLRPHTASPGGDMPELGRRAPGISTPFLPFLYADDLLPLETGQVVRIEMPRTALESFGLPMSEDRSAGRIQVDVLLGEDGLARGIRLLH